MKNKLNSKVKLIIYIAAFVVFIGGATIAYNLLSKEVKPEGDLSIVSSTDEAETDSSGASDAESPDEETITAPDFTVLDKDGNEVKLSDQFGKPIVLNFWASWCPPCKGEMPHFNKIYEEMGEDVIFMMVDSVDGQRETTKKGKEFIEENKYTFPTYYDESQDASYAYGITALPSTIFIDKDGNIIAAAQQAIDEETLLKGIELITEKK